MADREPAAKKPQAEVVAWDVSSDHSEDKETESAPPEVCWLIEQLDARWQTHFKSLKRKWEFKEEDERGESRIRKIEELNPGPRKEHETQRDILVIQEEGDDDEEKLCNPGSLTGEQNEEAEDALLMQIKRRRERRNGRRESQLEDSLKFGKDCQWSFK